MCLLKKVITFFLFSCIHRVTAKLRHQNPEGFESSRGISIIIRLGYGIEIEEPLWVLNMNNGIDSIRLTRGTSTEESHFKTVIGPLIDSLKIPQIQSLRRVKKDDPAKYDYHSDSKDNKMQEAENNKHVKEEIMRIINKFALSALHDPDLHLPESIDEINNISLALYFKGPFTSLIMKFGQKQWNYIIRPPSPLPRWFYEEHIDIIKDGKTSYVEIPDIVKNEFYIAILPMLRMFLSYPV